MSQVIDLLLVGGVGYGAYLYYSDPSFRGLVDSVFQAGGTAVGFTW